MMYDIFHSYGFDSKEDQKSLCEDVEPRNWKIVSSKSVQDIDGFTTDYVWYTDGYKHIFMIGDSEIVDPDIDYADWECDSEKEAQEWFDSYTGVEEEYDDDFNSSTSFSQSKEDFFDRGFNEAYGIDADDTGSLRDRGDILTETYNNLPQWFTKFLDNTTEGDRVRRLLSNRGIDLTNATYIQGQIPHSNRDPVLKDPNRISIFRLTNGKGSSIYVKGLNNPYIKLPGSWDFKYANELPLKTLLELTTEYGYIDTQDARNTNFAIRKERSLLKHNAGPQRGKGQYPVTRTIYSQDEYGRKNYDDPIGTRIEWITTPGQDKSGYTIDPEKYVKMLDNVGLDTYGDRLESYYTKIESVRNRLIALMNKFDINESNKFRTYGSFSDNIFSDIAQAMDSFGKSITAYQSLKKSCEEIVERYNDTTDTEELSERIASCFKWKSGYIRDYLKEAVDLIKKIETTERLPEEE